MATANVNGAQLEYEVTGSGDPVVFVHGAHWPTPTSHWSQSLRSEGSPESATTAGPWGEHSGWRPRNG